LRGGPPPQNWLSPNDVDSTEPSQFH
jgi:hypothetical protein